MVNISCVSNYKQDENSGKTGHTHKIARCYNKNASYIYILDAILCLKNSGFLKRCSGGRFYC